MQKVQRLKNIIKYQDCAVVSKEIIKKDTGTVTIFAFDKDQGLSEHTAPFDAMVEIIEGTAEVTIENQKNILQEGDMIIIPTGSKHSLLAIEQFKMMLVMIRS